MSLGTAPSDEPDDAPPLSDTEWQTLAALQADLDLGGPSPAPEVADLRPVAFIRRVVVWLRWLLDPKADGLPMPPLLHPRRPRRRRAVQTGRPAGG